MYYETKSNKDFRSININLRSVILWVVLKEMDAAGSSSYCLSYSSAAVTATEVAVAAETAAAAAAAMTTAVVDANLSKKAVVQ